MMGYFQYKSVLLLKMILTAVEDQDHRYDLDVFVGELQTGLCVLEMTYKQNVILDVEDGRVSLVDLEKKEQLFIYLSKFKQDQSRDRKKSYRDQNKLSLSRSLPTVETLTGSWNLSD